MTFLPLTMMNPVASGIASFFGQVSQSGGLYVGSLFSGMGSCM